jgi:predicted SAM-dependent methyltransferase
MLKPQIKHLLRRLHLYDQASSWWIWLRPKLDRPVRLLSGRDRQTIAQHFAAPGAKKLHIGCGPHNLEGWLNADLYPRGNQIRLDATRRFPLEDNSIDFVYTEHMIEHIPWPAALLMLKESFRVLKPGGIIRVATPNLDFLTGLLKGNLPESAKTYLRSNRPIWTAWAPDDSAIFAFNHFVRAWGHQFIFDAATLRRTLEMAGFSAIAERPLNESPAAELCGLAAETRMPPGFLAMETIVLEGTKTTA